MQGAWALGLRVRRPVRAGAEDAQRAIGSTKKATKKAARVRGGVPVCAAVP